MAVQLHQRLLLLLLRLLAASLPFAGTSTLAEAHDEATSSPGLHPVVLLPGYLCSQLEARLTNEYRPPAPRCGARKGGGWFRLWENDTAVRQDPRLVPCYADELRLVYDPVAGDYRDVRGVKTRAVAFGTTTGFGSDDPSNKNICMKKLVETLERVAGYREGKNLFGAPYDFRYAPGLAPSAFSRFAWSLTQLVERASKANGNKPVILVTHSLGGYNALAFLYQSPLPWRRRFVKHFVMLSVGVGGGALLLQVLASDLGNNNTSSPPPGNVLSFANTSRSFPTTLSLLPSPNVYGHKPLVITPDRNYSARDLPEFLSAVGFSDDEVARYRERALPVTLSFRAPLVPMTCINGVGVPTIDALVYPDGDLSSQPQVVFGDGDGTINLRTVLAWDTVVGGDPNQGYFKSVLIPNVTHNGMISDDLALNRVVVEILEANHQAAV